jgi:hypothetical protein
METNKIHGVPEGIYYGQNERTDELNARIGSRQFPNAQLQPNLDFRPVPTKYSIFPIIDRRTIPTVALEQHLDHNVEFNFNPGNARAPVTGYMNNVDKEMQLRNQFFALQKGGDKGTFIPNKSSDLYIPTIYAAPGEYSAQGGTHSLLFVQPEYNTNIHPNIAHSTVGKDRFFNHTRTQLRNTNA